MFSGLTLSTLAFYNNCNCLAMLTGAALGEFLSSEDAFKYTISSKINVTPKVVYLPISKLHSIVAVANLPTHNNISQISLQSAAVFLTPFGGNIYFAGDDKSLKYAR